MGFQNFVVSNKIHTLKTMDLDTFVVLTTGNLGRGYESLQAAEIQITRAHAGGVHFEQRRRDDT